LQLSRGQVARALPAAAATGRGRGA
jgi:hypothetical protein